MNIRLQYILLITCFIIFGCDNKKKSSNTSNVDTTENNVVNDTTFKSPPPPPPAPAPGTAVVRAKIITVKMPSDGKNGAIEMEIQEIRGYGAGTPLINAKQSIKTALTPSMAQKHSHLITKNEIVTATLKSPGPTLQLSDKASASDWQLVDLAAPKSEK